LSLDYQLTTRRAYGTADALDLLIRILGITADIFGVAAGTFAVARVARRTFRRLRERAGSQPNGDLVILTPSAAAS
jgi:hypothetical protein